MTPGLRLLAVGALPLLYIAFELGWLATKGRRRAALGLALLLIAAALPWQGVDFAYLKRANLLLVGTVVMVLALRLQGTRWLTEEREKRLLLVAAVSAVILFTNFFSFHGKHTWVHYHDVAHYYLGGKYFRELSYDGLYTAMLRAEAELHDNHFVSIEARDLATNRLVHVRDLLERSGPVKAEFSPERWYDFKRDVALFREALGAQYADVLRDHGFNPTPVWTLVGGALANRVGAGDRGGIVLLTLLDPLLLAGSLIVVVRTFGLRAALLAIIHYCVIFGASFGWAGGAFLRHGWLAATVTAFCALSRGRHGLAGGLLAIASALRVFPAAFVAGAFLSWRWLPGGRGQRDAQRLLLGFAASGLALTLASGWVPRGFAEWGEFHRNMTSHVEGPAENLVGLTGPLVYAFYPEAAVNDPGVHARVYGLQLLTILPGALIWAIVAARRRFGIGSALVALPLVLAGLNLASYYWSMLVLLTLAESGTG